ncbi:two-component sensor histidine kinase [Rhodoblastus acidophilus]|uniref:sensor histidine kinase n=1 Tax=Rhodoblastus acidophilus TaxID=1074 RepID=UPI002224D315|nr:PAS domain-containing sensor histidine kinase [Rhodoblastus acidophilus]MCW2283180.1 two-component sensor histidine kinase [Rhodoblastus acidophilus]MCW2332040.1 two-component sensor histidine kinase [Rhodoblastus acidophilus]
MRFVSDIAAGVACFSGALAVLFYLRSRASLLEDSRRVAWFAIAGLSAFGLSRFLDAFMLYAPGSAFIESLEIISVGVALTLSLACWGLIPGLIALPSRGDLMAENARLEKAVAERTRALDEANQRFVHALKTTRVSMAQQDLELRYQWVHNLPSPLHADAFIGRLPCDVVPADALSSVLDASQRALEHKTLVQNELAVTLDGSVRYFDQSIEPLWRDGEVVGLLTTAIDATEHRRRQDELTFLLSELTHRTKNLLAVIQGIARQSSRSATDVQSFVQKFNGRIRALALTHELLVETKWRGVDLRQLLTAAWKAAWPGGGQAVLRGPPCVLSPECAQNVALAVYEMAANAASHLDGARAGPNVAISWAPVAGDGFAGLELVWREKSPTRPAPEPDFGLTLVEDLLPRATEGPSRIVYDDAGLLWTLRIDDKQLRLPN